MSKESQPAQYNFIKKASTCFVSYLLGTKDIILQLRSFSGKNFKTIEVLWKRCQKTIYKELYCQLQLSTVKPPTHTLVLENLTDATTVKSKWSGIQIAASLPEKNDRSGVKREFQPKTYFPNILPKHSFKASCYQCHSLAQLHLSTCSFRKNGREASQEWQCYLDSTAIPATITLLE